MQLHKNKVIGYETVGQWLRKGQSTSIYVRHAARPPLEEDDPTFGADLSLTDEGKQQALGAGKIFHGAAESIKLFASPMTRTRMTARLIGEGAGTPTNDLKVIDADEIGVGNIFYDSKLVHGRMLRDGVMVFLMEYFTAGTAEGAFPVAEAAANALEWIKQQSNSHLNVFASHDVNMAAMLVGLELNAVTADEWIPYLTGVALTKVAEVWQVYPLK